MAVRREPIRALTPKVLDVGDQYSSGTVFNENEAGVKCSGTCQLDEVIDVASDQDSILGVRAFQNDVILGFEQATVSNVNDVETLFVPERFGDANRQILIEQKFDVHVGAQRAGRPRVYGRELEVLVLEIRVILWWRNSRFPRLSTNQPAESGSASLPEGARGFAGDMSRSLGEGADDA
jgi:hypothetical protein